jgi:amino acid permease
VLAVAAAALVAQLVLIAACRRQLGALCGVRYADVARAALGPAGALLADLSIAVACFGEPAAFRCCCCVHLLRMCASCRAPMH